MQPPFFQTLQVDLPQHPGPEGENGVEETSDGLPVIRVSDRRVAKHQALSFPSAIRVPRQRSESFPHKFQGRRDRCIRSRKQALC